MAVITVAPREPLADSPNLSNHDQREGSRVPDADTGFPRSGFFLYKLRILNLLSGFIQSVRICLVFDDRFFFLNICRAIQRYQVTSTFLHMKFKFKFKAILFVNVFRLVYHTILPIRNTEPRCGQTGGQYSGRQH